MSLLTELGIILGTKTTNMPRLWRSTARDETESANKVPKQKRPVHILSSVLVSAFHPANHRKELGSKLSITLSAPFVR
jgi:hypothetical protein